jgi:hypothetical protein
VSTRANRRLVDDVVFHCSLFMAEVIHSNLRQSSETTSRALKHQSKTYRYITESIKRNESPSDVIMASVISMVIHEDHKLHMDRARMHLNALAKMIVMRGGMDTLESNLTLLYKICRTDIDSALRAGEKPKFWRHRLPTPLHEHTEEIDLKRISLLSNNELRQIVVDLLQTTDLLRNDPARFKLHPNAYQELLISVSYRLSSLQLATDSLDYTIQLGLTSLTTTLLFMNLSSKSLYPHLQSQLQNLLQNKSQVQLLNGPVRLWLLFAGGISVLDDEDKTWLIPQIRRCLADLRIDDWQGAKVALRVLPWFDALHDSLGYELYKVIPWHEQLPNKYNQSRGICGKAAKPSSLQH